MLKQTRRSSGPAVIRSSAARSVVPFMPGAFTAAVALLLLGVTPGFAGKHALLIGISDYQRFVPPQPGAVVSRPIDNLRGPTNDVAAMQAVLVGRGEFLAKDITVLADQTATRARILAEFERIFIRDAGPGDQVVFYFAGHGSQIKNLKSAESDKLDETIVPADARYGTPDIRDKELARLFQRSLARGVILTALFDSCHSGSIGRGYPSRARPRYAPPAALPVSVPDPVLPSAAASGALIMSAAQEFQSAYECTAEDQSWQGCFTGALVRGLTSAPSSEPAPLLFARVAALMQNNPLLQSPVLEASAARRHQSLFGGPAASASGPVRVALHKVPETGALVLQGGLAVGLHPGCELRQSDAKGAPLRLRVTQVMGPGSALAEPLQSSREQFRAGQLFTIERWAAASDATLRVHLGPTNLPFRELMDLMPELEQLHRSDRLTWVEDPTDPRGSAPTHVLGWNGTEWLLQTTDGTDKMLGGKLLATRVLAELSAAAARPALFVDLPVPTELAAQLKRSTESGTTLVTVQPTRDDAHYYLVGRLSQGSYQYALVRPGHEQGSRQSELSSLPTLTSWVPFNQRVDPEPGAQLGELALRLGKLHGWLMLTPPQSDGSFPYHLALKNLQTGQLVPAKGRLIAGSSYGAELVRDEDAAVNKLRARYVYLFAIDSHGDSTLLFPDPVKGNADNHFPLVVGTAPPNIPLADGQKLFDVSPPFGVDTFVLLSTVEPLATPTVLAFPGVVLNQVPRLDSPLARLLFRLGAGVRSAMIGELRPVPLSWSIERLPALSVPVR